MDPKPSFMELAFQNGKWWGNWFKVLLIQILQGNKSNRMCMCRKGRFISRNFLCAYGDWQVKNYPSRLASCRPEKCPCLIGV